MPRCDHNPQMPYAERCSAEATMRLDWAIIEYEHLHIGAARMCQRHALSEAEYIGGLEEAIAYVTPLLAYTLAVRATILIGIRNKPDEAQIKRAVAIVAKIYNDPAQSILDEASRIVREILDRPHPSALVYEDPRLRLYGVPEEAAVHFQPDE